MKNINQFIIEKFKLSSKNIGHKYNYHPKDKEELEELIKKLIKERGIDADLNDIDTSKITDMSNLFKKNEFNGNISEWDVSNVENMSLMFAHSIFNNDISKWDVSNVVTMYQMFAYSKFNGDISNWDVSNVKDMDYIFRSCPLEKNPPKWYKK